MLPAPVLPGIPDQSNCTVEYLPAAGDCLAALDQGACHLVVLAGRREVYEACRTIRGRRAAPGILLLVPEGGSAERAEALRCGADDCLTAPYDAGEVAARVEALLRRVGRHGAEPRLILPHGVEVDWERRGLWREGQWIEMTRKEARLLHYLASRQGEAASRAELLRVVWGYESARTRTVDMHIAMLRQKLEENRHHPQHLLTVRGLGYSFRR